MRAQQLDETERKEMIDVLERIEEAGRAIAAELGADVRVEKGGGGRFPYLTFRAFGTADRHHDAIGHPLASADCFEACNDDGEIAQNRDETQI